VEQGKRVHAFARHFKRDDLKIVVFRPDSEINDPHSPAVQFANQPLWADSFADLATIGCFGELFSGHRRQRDESSLCRLCRSLTRCDFGSEFVVISASASQVRGSIGQGKLERGMKNMFYELPAIHVDAGIHTRRSRALCVARLAQVAAPTDRRDGNT